MDDAARRAREIELIQLRHYEFESRYSPGPDWEPFNQTHRDRGFLLTALRELEAERDSLRRQFPWHRGDVGLPDVPVLQPRYDALRAERDALATRLARVEGALRWALGEDGDFPPRAVGEGAYWWRKELRRRAALTPDATTEGT